MLRDIRDGVEPPPAPRQVPAPSSPAAPRHDELWMGIIGKSIVLIPLALLIALALWTGYLQVVGTGGSKTVAVLSSVGSVVAMIVAVWALSRRKKH